MAAVTITKSHIGAYKIHRLLWDQTTTPDDQYPGIRDSVGAHGLTHPIVRYLGEIISGRTRLRACYETGTSPRFEEFHPKGKTAQEIEAEIRIRIKIDDWDRKHLSQGERAEDLALLFPPLPRGRPKKSPEDADPENQSNDRITRPPDAELARLSGIAPKTLTRARESIADRNKVKKLCIKEIQKLVEDRAVSERDAVNVADLDRKTQKACLAEFKAERSYSLTAARAKLCSNRTGKSAKTELYWVEGVVPIEAESAALAVDMFEKRNGDDNHEAIGRAVGLTVGGIKSFVKCVKCRGLVYDITPQKKVPAGVEHKECPDGRNRE